MTIVTSGVQRRCSSCCHRREVRTHLEQRLDRSGTTLSTGQTRRGRTTVTAPPQFRLGQSALLLLGTCTQRPSESSATTGWPQGYFDYCRSPSVLDHRSAGLGPAHTCQKQGGPIKTCLQTAREGVLGAHAAAGSPCTLPNATACNSTRLPRSPQPPSSPAQGTASRVRCWS